MIHDSINKHNQKNHNKGFSLVELIVVIAIMAVLVGILSPSLIRHIHKARVAADWANLRNYYTEIQADFNSTGEFNPNVPTDLTKRENWELREIKFLDGQTVKMKAGYFAIAIDENSGYHISYYCDKCLNEWDEHSQSCILALGFKTL